MDFFLSWLARFYRGAHEFNLESGQSAFILGNTGVGKTFLSQGLLPHLMGGSANAESYLMGQTVFNSELFQVALWTVDDNSVNTDNASHRRFSSLAKSLAANSTFQFNEKFRVPCSVEWTGRLLVTANRDEVSARIVPNLSISILDKLNLFLAADVPAVEFPDRAGCKAIIRREAPFFARWLLSYEPPAECRGTARFGVRSYHEESLLTVADQSSDTAGFHEILESWRSRYFPEKQVDKWTGSAFELLLAFGNDTSFGNAIRGLTSRAVGQQLSALKASGLPCLDCSTGSSIRTWTIFRTDTPPPAERAIVQREKSNFAK